RLPFAAPRRGRLSGQAGEASRAADRVQLRELLQPVAHEVGVDEPLLRRLHGYLRSTVLNGHLARLADRLRMPDYDTKTHDVLVIGAGGAGLRAAIAAAAEGVSVGLVCKSLLG